jgi:hypothetical protein
VVKHAVGQRREWHPEALACASHDGFTITLCRPRRPATTGTVEKHVETRRAWCLRGRPGTDVRHLKAPWHAWHDAAWLPHRHRTTGTTMAARRPEDQAALQLLPSHPYDVCERTTRQVGQDGRGSGEGALDSAPAACAGQRIARRLFPARVCLPTLEAVPRALT